MSSGSESDYATVYTTETDVSSTNPFSMSTADENYGSTTTNRFNPFSTPTTPHSDIVNAIENLQTTLTATKVNDLRHVETFSGDNKNTENILKLKYLLLDLNEYFNSRCLSEVDKILIAKQKLTGSAKQLINQMRPETFLELETCLYSSFGIINNSYESLVSELKSCNVRNNESFQQFYLRIKDIATVLSIKLNCNLSNLSVFEPLSKALLNKLPSHISTQSEIISACQNRDIHSLYTCISNIIRFNPEVWKHESKPTNPFKKVSNVVTCGNCYKPGHVVKDCRAPISNNKQFFRSFK